MIKKINQAASILGLVLCAVLAYVFWKAGLFDSKEALTSCISRFGWAGPAVFITFQAVQVVIPILPGGLGCLAGVILFGAWKGFWYNYIGICAGSMAAFAIARACGRPLLESVFPAKMIEKYDRWMGSGSRFAKCTDAVVQIIHTFLNRLGLMTISAFLQAPRASAGGYTRPSSCCANRRPLRCTAWA